ncbi:uncharacterized protein OCT59_008598 [Rhizophagus irregularis]|uniref:uncharacterized protein n=1 Tax=Rhizophagus irregularis TaxID=588596 RepID=UPI00332D73A0|nr:hypothetical protein OCT59_008598 [Rhizophagus irregularis]
MDPNAGIAPQRPGHSKRDGQKPSGQRIQKASQDKQTLKEKAGDDLGQSFEEEGIGNRELHELNWKAYQKACKELSEARKEHCMVRWTIERCGFH